MNVNIEATVETVKLVNNILYQIVRNNEGLSDEEKDGLEKFRLDMVKPIILDSDHPLSEAFLQYFPSIPANKKKKR